MAGLSVLGDPGVFAQTVWSVVTLGVLQVVVKAGFFGRDNFQHRKPEGTEIVVR